MIKFENKILFVAFGITSKKLAHWERLSYVSKKLLLGSLKKSLKPVGWFQCVFETLIC